MCDCKENGITDCKCSRYFSQPDCDIGCDSSRDCFYHSYYLYMLVDSQSNLPIFPHYKPTEKVTKDETTKEEETDKPTEKVTKDETNKPVENETTLGENQTEKPTEEPTTDPKFDTSNSPKKNTKLTAKSGEKYKVTTVGSKGKSGCVEYLSAKSKNAAKVVVPATVKIGGITYKVTSVAAKAFKNSKKVKTVTIGKNVKKIGAQAFYNCKNLKTVEIGEKVKTIGSKAFYKSGNLKNISVKSKYFTTKSVSANAFTKINKKVIVSVPKSKLTSYKKILKKKGIKGKSQKVQVLYVIYN